MACGLGFSKFVFCVLIIAGSLKFLFCLVEIAVVESLLAVLIVHYGSCFLCTLLGVLEVACSLKACNCLSIVAFVVSLNCSLIFPGRCCCNEENCNACCCHKGNAADDDGNDGELLLFSLICRRSRCNGCCRSNRCSSGSCLNGRHCICNRN